MWDPDFMGIIWDSAFRDQTFVRYCREKLEMNYEHLAVGSNRRMTAEYDGAKGRGVVRVHEWDGSVLVETEVNRWA